MGAEFCTIDDVKRSHNITGAEWDTQIAAWIPTASDLVAEATKGRKLVADKQGSTRSYDVRGASRTRELMIDDLSAAPTAVVVLDAWGTTVWTCDIPTEILTLPLNLTEEWMPIDGIRFRPNSIALAPTHVVQVTGTWGFPKVPSFVTEATIETVREWLRGVQALTTGSPDPDDPVIRIASRGVPPAAIRLLQPIRRKVIA